MTQNPGMILPPDAEAAVVDLLVDALDLVSTPGGDPTVSTNMVGYTPGVNWVVVQTVGGQIKWPHIFVPRIDVEVLAERRSLAFDIARVCLAAIRAQQGIYRGYGMFISDVRIDQYPTRIDDKYEESPRYIFTVALTCTVDNTLPPFS